MIGRWIIASALWLFFNASSTFAASPARHTIGPTTIRGTANNVGGRGFSLLSPSKGLFAVSTTHNTQYLEAGAVGRVRLQNGDHVGVRGFLRGHVITAMTVRIYPSHAAPAAHSVRGTVVSIHGATIAVRTGTLTLHATVGRGTAIRIGSKSGSLRDIHGGDRVELRITRSACCPVALHIHVYRSKAVLRHVELKGTVAAVRSGTVVVLSGGKPVSVSLSAKATVYVGRKRSTSHSVVPGTRITVYACCAGTALAATSIHVASTPVAAKSVLVRGSVAAIGSGSLTVNTTRGAVRVAVDHTTRWELGGSPMPASGARVGDYISLRVQSIRGDLHALRVHVYPEYRTVHVLRGVVVAASSTTLAIRTRGRVTQVKIGAGTGVTEGKARVRVTQLHGGQHVTVWAREIAPGVFVASGIVVKLVAVKAATITGTVSAVHGSEVDITDAAGERRRLVLPPGGHPVLRGGAAPPGALFPGVRVTSRGVPSGAVIQVTTLVVHLTVRDLKGRVTTIGHGYIAIRTGIARSASLGILPLLHVWDGGKAVSVGVVRSGTFVSAHIFQAAAGDLRVASLTVLHPALSVRGTVTATTPRMTVRTSAGETYVLIISASTIVVSSRNALSITPDEAPAGAKVNFSGVAQTDGTIRVHRLTVTLRSREIRGSVVSMAPGAMSIRTAAGDVTVRLASATTFLQGTRSLGATDLVVGDDVTVYGYTAASGAVIARKVTVHRRLAGVSGQVGAISPDGFVLNAADGAHPVIVGSAVIWSGGTASALAVGLSVHVTGYLRGDGAIIATRVRIGKGR